MQLEGSRQHKRLISIGLSVHKKKSLPSFSVC
jgi:hypothetical protein